MPPKQPLQVIKFGGKHKRSKKQIEQREQSEIKLGSKKLILPSSVKGDKVALKKWKELVSLYDDIEYVSSADSGILAQYCLCHSEHEYLISSKNDIVEEMKNSEGVTVVDIITYLDKSNLDNMINKKREALQKIGTKIFLDPTARIKAIPLKEPEKPKSAMDEFLKNG